MLTYTFLLEETSILISQKRISESLTPGSSAELEFNGYIITLYEEQPEEHMYYITHILPPPPSTKNHKPFEWPYIYLLTLLLSWVSVRSKYLIECTSQLALETAIYHWVQKITSASMTSVKSTFCSSTRRGFPKSCLLSSLIILTYTIAYLTEIVQTPLGAEDDLGIDEVRWVHFLLQY